MFSANENLVLRQAKRRVVGYIEATIPDDVLDLGTNVMVMQVSCKAPGCVPVETAVIIVFPAIASTNGDNNNKELLPGLPESKGGSFKTKILKPLNEVTQQDVLDALPPAFEGGLRTTERLCLQARDVMFAQITQLFGGYPDEDNDNDADADADDADADKGDVEGRRLMATYLQQSLLEYMERNCIPPPWGEPFPETKTDSSATAATAENDSPETLESTSSPSSALLSLQGTGNLVIRRKRNEEDNTTVTRMPSQTTTTTNSDTSTTVSSVSSSVNSVSRRRQQQAADQRILAYTNTSNSNNSNSILSRLSSREHAPGVRRPGCPCCDPDHPNTVVDRMLLL